MEAASFVRFRSSVVFATTVRLLSAGGPLSPVLQQLPLENAVASAIPPPVRPIPRPLSVPRPQEVQPLPVSALLMHSGISTIANTTHTDEDPEIKRNQTKSNEKLIWK